MKRSTVWLAVTVALAGLIGLGIGLRMFWKSVVPPESDESASSSSTTQPNPRPARETSNDPVVSRLMTQFGLDLKGATYLAKAKVQVLSESKNSVQLTFTFPDGATADETVTIQPNLQYTPTPEELARAAQTGVQAFNVQLSVTPDGPDRMQITLQYFVPNSSLPPDLQQAVQAPATSAGWFQLVPSAWAQGGGAGAGAAGGMGGMGVKVGFGVGGLAWGIYSGMGKYSQNADWMSQLAALENCVQHPTNPLTQKAYQDNPAYQQQTLDGLQQASSQVRQVTGARFLAQENAAAAGFVGGPGGFVLKAALGGLTYLNDQVLKDVGNRQISDIAKSVTKCNDEPARKEGDLKPATLSVAYLYNRTIAAGGGYSGQKTFMRKAMGEISLKALPGGGLEGSGTVELVWKEQVHTEGMGHVIDDGTLDVTGPLKVEAEGGGDATNGSLHIEFSADDTALTSVAVCNVCGRGGQRTVRKGPELVRSCTVHNLDLVHGGDGSAYIDQDEGYGTCRVEVTRK